MKKRSQKARQAGYSRLRATLSALMALILCAAMLTGMAPAARAAGDASLTVRVPEDKKEKFSDIDLKKVEIEVFKIGSLDNGSWTLDAEYKKALDDAGVTLSAPPTAEEIEKATPVFEAYIKKAGKPAAKSGNLDASGSVTLSKLDPGYYLVRKKVPATANEESADSKKFKMYPFLVNLETSVTVDAKVDTDDIKLIDITVEKFWDDKEAGSSHRPKTIQIQLLADGVPCKRSADVSFENTATIQIEGKTEWSYTWKDLYAYDFDGKRAIEYSVKEMRDEGNDSNWKYYGDPTYTPTGKDSSGIKTVKNAVKAEDGNDVIGFTVRNPHKKGSLWIEKKVTVDGKATTTTAADGTYTFKIEGQEGLEYSCTASVTIKNGKSTKPKVEVPNLPCGKYKVTEVAPTNGTKLTVDDGKIIEVTSDGTAQVATKSFTNNLETGGMRIYKQVTLNGSSTSSKKVDGTYYFTVTGPKGYKKENIPITINAGARNHVDLKDLVPGKYTVAEQTPKNGSKVVGSKSQSVTVVANKVSDTSVTFTNNLDEVTPPPSTTRPPTETTPPPTKTTPPPSEPTPTPSPTTEVNGQKIWRDDDDVHGLRPDDITVELLADGVVVSSTPIWRSRTGNTWSFSFINLPVENEDGNTITYTVRELPVEGYTATVDGNTITNELIPRTPTEYINIAGVKVWDDSNNASGSRPNYITVRLLRDGVEIEQRTVTAANEWQYAFQNLPQDDGYGHTYTYTLREDTVAGYFTRINGYNITNSKLPEPIEDNPTPLGTQSEEGLEELLDLFDYGTPLFGELLQTGDETPMYPYIFGGIGALAVLILLVAGRRRRREEE